MVSAGGEADDAAVGGLGEDPAIGDPLAQRPGRGPLGRIDADEKTAAAHGLSMVLSRARRCSQSAAACSASFLEQHIQRLEAHRAGVGLIPKPEGPRLGACCPCLR